MLYSWGTLLCPLIVLHRPCSILIAQNGPAVPPPGSHSYSISSNIKLCIGTH